MSAGAFAAPLEPRSAGIAPSFASPLAARAPAALRVLHVYGGHGYGGVDSFLRVLGRRPASATMHTPLGGLGGVELPPNETDETRALAEFALCADGKLAADLRAEGAAVHVLGDVLLREPASVVRVRGGLKALLRSRAYDVAVCHSSAAHAVFAPAVRAAGVPLVHFMHDVPRRRSWLDLWAGRVAPDLVVCNGTLTLEAGRWLFGDVPRRVLIPGVDVDRFSTRRTSRGAVRASLGVAGDAVVILHATRMRPSGGQRLLLDALARMAPDPRWTCWIAGRAQGPEEEAHESHLRRRVRRLGLGDRVRFVGLRDDMADLMSAADVFCHSSVRPEAFSAAVVEALASSLPVVATRLGGLIELVTPACGRLADATPAALAQCLSTLVEDGETRARLASEGPPRARAMGDPRGRVNDSVTTLEAVAAAPCVMKARRPDEGLADTASRSAIVRRFSSTRRAIGGVGFFDEEGPHGGRAGAPHP